MFYYPIITASFKATECKNDLKENLEIIKGDVDNLVHWNKQYVDECNCQSTETKELYNSDYLELQRLIKKILE